ncbi:MAG: hypothetical protein HS115_18270 [Spirochaetales bacterium]|nr:hypothetical protein [Spirochaetales bacterium]
MISVRLFILFMIFSVPLSAHTGQRLFAEAQQMEAVAPDRALELYEEALQHRLDSKLRRATLYRIKVLKARAAPSSEISLTGEAAVAYREGLELLKAGENGYLEKFAAAIELATEKEALRLRVARDLARAGQADQARIHLEPARRRGPEYTIFYIDLLVSLKSYKKAEEELHWLSEQEVSAEEKPRILYLLGRLKRDQQNEVGAIRYFRLASGYARGAEADRYRALAAFSMYRLGYAIQARSLLRSLDGPPQSDFKLLDLLLAAEVDGDIRSLEALKRYVKQMDRSSPGFLEKRALELAGES